MSTGSPSTGSGSGDDEKNIIEQWETERMQLPKHGLNVGDKVVVNWGDTLYNAVVQSIDSKRGIVEESLVAVHYHGWDLSKDELIPRSRIKVCANGIKSVKWHDNEEYACKEYVMLSAQHAAAFKVKFEGWEEDEWDEWIIHPDRWHMLPSTSKSSSTSKPTSSSKPRKPSKTKRASSLPASTNARATTKKRKKQAQSTASPARSRKKNLAEPTHVNHQQKAVHKKEEEDLDAIWGAKELSSLGTGDILGGGTGDGVGNARSQAGGHGGTNGRRKMKPENNENKYEEDFVLHLGDELLTSDRYNMGRVYGAIWKITDISDPDIILSRVALGRPCLGLKSNFDMDAQEIWPMTATRSTDAMSILFPQGYIEQIRTLARPIPVHTRIATPVKLTSSTGDVKDEVVRNETVADLDLNEWRWCNEWNGKVIPIHPPSVSYEHIFTLALDAWRGSPEYCPGIRSEVYGSFADMPHLYESMQPQQTESSAFKECVLPSPFAGGTHASFTFLSLIHKSTATLQQAAKAIYRPLSDPRATHFFATRCACLAMALHTLLLPACGH